MEITFKKGKFFKKLIEFCKDLIPSANLIFDKNGISLNSLDSNHISLIFFQINIESFSKFKLTEDDFIKLADEALFICKDKGRNCCSLYENKKS